MTDNETYLKRAWGDESVRVSAPTPAYLMAAAVLPDVCDFSRLAQCKPKGAAKLHWRDLNDRRRREALDAVAEIGAEITIARAAPLPKKKQERGRRKCLKALLPELEGTGVGALVLESRVLKQNSKDIDMLDAMRAKHAVVSFGIDHAYADEEPRLWIPDLVLGAYGDSLCGKARETWETPWKIILPRLRIIKAQM